MDALIRNPQDEEDSAFDALHESFWLVIGFICLAVALLTLAGCCHCKSAPKQTPTATVIEKKAPSKPVISPAPKPEPIVLQEVQPK